VPDREVSTADKCWLIIASTFLVAALVTQTSPCVDLRLPAPTASAQPDSEQDNRAALRASLLCAVLYCAAIAALALPAGAPLRDPDSASLLNGAFIRALVVLVALGFACCGLVYGKVSGRFRTGADVIEAM